MTSGGTSRSIAERLDPRDNALNLLRLVLAGLVIVSHAWPLGGFGGDPHIGDLKLGTFAVGGFFAISGFLICKSRLHLGLGAYLWRRFLRIAPGLWVCALVVAFLIAPLDALLRGGWSLREALGFSGARAMLLESHFTVGTTLIGTPGPEAWNGALWTIRYEVACYVLAGVAGCLGVFRRQPWLTAAGFVGTSLVSAAAVVFDVGIEGSAGKALYLLPFFLAGALLLQYADAVPLNGAWALLACVVLASGAAVGELRVVAPLPVAYVLLWAAVALPAQVRRLGAVNDLSYGVYLYGWPVAKLLAVYGAASLGLAGYTAACLAAVFPFAGLSWWLVERPAMRLKTLRRSRAAHRSTCRDAEPLREVVGDRDSVAR